MSLDSARTSSSPLRVGGRIVALTLVLVVAGAMLGAVGGGLLSMLVTARVSGIGRIAGDMMYAVGSAALGSVVGAVGAPVLGWALLGDVPLWRALVEPAAGAILGAGLAVLLRPGFGMLLGGGALGLLLAIVRLVARAGQAAPRDVSAPT